MIRRCVRIFITFDLISNEHPYLYFRSDTNSIESRVFVVAVVCALATLLIITWCVKQFSTNPIILMLYAAKLLPVINESRKTHDATAHFFTTSPVCDCAQTTNPPPSRAPLQTELLMNPVAAAVLFALCASALENQLRHLNSPPSHPIACRIIII